jgi:hypothetical protein
MFYEIYIQGEPQYTERFITQHRFSLLVPQYFYQAMDTNRFIWLRQKRTNKQLHLFLYWKENRAAGLQSAEKVILERDLLLKQYIYYSKKDTASYVRTEYRVPIDSTLVDFNGFEAIRLRGAWKTGGQEGIPKKAGEFLSYSFYDQQSRRQYYLEGMLYDPEGGYYAGPRPGDEYAAFDPKESKINYLRRLDAILRRFKTYNQ